MPKPTVFSVSLAAAAFIAIALPVPPALASCAEDGGMIRTFASRLLGISIESCKKGDRFTASGRCQGRACGDAMFGISGDDGTIAGGAFADGAGALFVIRENPDGSVSFSMLFDDGTGNPAGHLGRADPGSGEGME